MNTKSVTIAGHAFDLLVPYEVGHTINEAETKTLNQVRHENVRNNVAKAVKELIEAGKLDEAKIKVAQYDAEYVFTVATASAPRLDPVDREARAIAKELIRAHLAKTNRTFKTVPEGMSKEDWEAKVEENIAKTAATESVLKEARKTVAAKSKRMEALGAELDLG